MVLRWEKNLDIRGAGYVHTKGDEVVLPATNAVHEDELVLSVFS